MSEILLKRKTTVEDIEQLYTLLYNDADEFLNVVLPKEFDAYDIGFIQLLIQFLGTCIRFKNQCLLLIDIDTEPKSISEFMMQQYAYPSVILFWFQGIYCYKDKLKSLKPHLVPFTNRIRYEMKSLTNIKGQRLLLTCFDHFTPEKGLLDCFYDGNRFIKSDAILSFTLNDAIREVLSFNKKASIKSLAPIIEDLIAIIYELMKNTDEWGKTDISDKPMSPNIRGLQLRFLRRPKDKLIERYQSFAGVKDYFNSFEPISQNLIYFLEISVFDCGIGFVEKRTGRTTEEIDIKEQVEIIKDCLIKNNTSAHGLAKEGKGLGLDRILRTINNKGLLWIRTSNVSLFRNLKSEPYTNATKASQVALFDWYNNSTSDFSKQPKVSGAAISILYPITLTDE